LYTTRPPFGKPLLSFFPPFLNTVAFSKQFASIGGRSQGDGVPREPSARGGLMTPVLACRAGGSVVVPASPAAPAGPCVGSAPDRLNPPDAT